MEKLVRRVDEQIRKPGAVDVAVVDGAAMKVWERSKPVRIQAPVPGEKESVGSGK